jgi:hypothetical protein
MILQADLGVMLTLDIKLQLMLTKPILSSEEEIGQVSLRPKYFYPKGLSPLKLVLELPCMEEVF